MSYRSYWSKPDALLYLLEPLLVLLAYVGIALWATRPISPDHSAALAYGTAVGVASGTLWVINLALETFAHISALHLVATAPFLLGGFILWGVAGYVTSLRTRRLSAGVLSAVWSAMVCVLLTITFGLLLTFTTLRHLSYQMLSDPDFLRSRWQDPSAFAIANSFDSAFSHLLGGILVGVVVGYVGATLAHLGRRIRVALHGAQKRV